MGQGRLRPTTSVTQYAATLATLATWFGMADSEVAGAWPNIVHFGAASGRAGYAATTASCTSVLGAQGAAAPQ